MEIKVPEVGESIHEAEIGQWHKKDGDRVEKGDLICELETDKITLEVNAEASGVLSIKIQKGQTVEVGTVIGSIQEEEEEAEREEKDSSAEEEEKPEEESAEQNERAEKAEKTEKSQPEESREKKPESEKDAPEEAKPSQPKRKPAEGIETEPEESVEEQEDSSREDRTTRRKMSRIRQRIAERLLKARQETAMLTTFNEADLGRVMDLRKKWGEQFRNRHGVDLGLMSFFVKAVVEALKEFPDVNARIDGEEIVYHHFYDIGIAVSSDKGLVVPVIRDAENLHFAEIEQKITGFAEKVRDNQLELSDLEGGTFSITNGGVFGSMLSTPLLNPPQSAILGMHAIQKRPVARDGKVVIRPMMYLALSYDHRIIDGREAVSFLKKVVEYVEEPEEMLLEM